MSFKDILEGHSTKKLDITVDNINADTINGASLPSFGTIASGDLVQRNPIIGNPIFVDSNLNVSSGFGNVTVTPSTPTDILTMTSNSVSGMNINFPNGQLNLNGLSQHSVLFGDCSISANNGVVLQGAGGQQVNLSLGGVNIVSQIGSNVIVQAGSLFFRFDGNSTGSYIFPLADGLPGQSLKTDGAGNLYWG